MAEALTHHLFTLWGLFDPEEEASLTLIASPSRAVWGITGDEKFENIL